MNISRKALIALVVPIVFGAFPVYATTYFQDFLAANPGAIDYVTDTTDGFTPSASIGRSGTSNSQISLRYVPGSSHNICSVLVALSAVGSPTDAVFMNVSYWGLESSGFGPTLGASMNNQGTLIGNAVSGFQVRSTLGQAYEFQFSPCLTVVGANRYNFNLYRSGSLENTNYYQYANTSVSNGGYSQSGSWNIAQQLLYRGWSSTGATNSYPAEGAYPLVAFYGTQNYGAITASTSPTFAQSIINTVLGITDQNATSTISTGDTGLNIFSNIPKFFAERVPFGYIYSIKDIITSTATTSTDFGTVSFDFSSASISTTTRGFLPGKINVLSTSTVTAYLSPSLLTALNSVISASILFGFLIYLFNRIKGSVQPV